MGGGCTQGFFLMLFYTTVPGCPGMGEEPFVQGQPGQSPSHLWPSLSSLSKRLQRHPSLEMLSLHWLTPMGHKCWLGSIDVKAPGLSATLGFAKESYCKDKPWGWSPCDHKTSQKKLSLVPLLGAGDQHWLQGIIHCHHEWENVQ